MLWFQIFQPLFFVHFFQLKTTKEVFCFGLIAQLQRHGYCLMIAYGAKYLLYLSFGQIWLDWHTANALVTYPSLVMSNSSLI